MSEPRNGGRERRVTGQGHGVERTGEGLGTGPVGQGTNRNPGPHQGRGNIPQGTPSGRSSQSSFPQSRPRTPTGHAGGVFTGGQAGRTPVGSSHSTNSRPSTRPASSGSSGQRPSPRRGGLSPILIVVVLFLIFGGGGSMLFGGSDNNGGNNGYDLPVAVVTQAPVTTIKPTATIRPTAVKTAVVTATPKATKSKATATPKAKSTKKPSNWYAQALSGITESVDTNSSDLTVTGISGTRERYTKLAGNGKDTVTIMVYMCGTDLESRSGMASADLQEMARATYGDNVRIIVYTGGCRSWKVSGISSSVNQIWRVQDGKLQRLVADDGSKSMTNPSTLSGFIRYCASNYPASRYELILWDHGGGSVTGYGYDEKNASAGAMSLAGLNTALKDGGVKFDFVGFDACLMATVETALMTSRYADYMIASEESEPGIGWYYTDWLTSLGRNTSKDTPSIGKEIVDDFVTACARRVPGQTTTLSVIDLVQLETQMPQAFSDFSKSISSLIQNKEYKTVSTARNGSREFARSSKIDQVDLADLALRMGNQEGKRLAEVIQSCVKYNRVSGVTNAYGLSVYFPYKKISNVDKAVKTYQQIGMDDAYADCIRAFASLESSGQIAAGGYSSPIGSLMGGGYSNSSAYSSEDLLNELLGSFFGGTSSNTGSMGSLDFLFGRNLSDQDITEYVLNNHLDAEELVFTPSDNGMVLALSETNREMVSGIDQNIYVDDGKGFIDLGLDNVYAFDAEGNLIADLSGVWLSIDGQIVPYYHLTSDKLTNGGYRYTGYIPALLNGTRVNLQVVFDSEHEYGYITGTQTDYISGETEAIAKVDGTIQKGDILQFVCDYYSYDGTYSNSYIFGKPVTVGDSIIVSDAFLPADLNLRITYRITDIYNQVYWTNTMSMATE